LSKAKKKETEKQRRRKRERYRHAVSHIIGGEMEKEEA